MLTNKLTSVVLVDNNTLDNFVNSKLLESYGVKNVVSFLNPNKALSYLEETTIKIELILIDIHMFEMDGFEFIEKMQKSDLDKKHGNMCLLSASLNPLHKLQSDDKKIRFIEKPLNIESLLLNI